MTCCRSAAWRPDRGSATLWVLGLAALVIAVALTVVVRGSAVLARHRLERAADLAALAAAEQIGRDGKPCAAAARSAAANGAVLASCTAQLDPSGRSGTVAITVRRTANFALIGDRTLAARARAERQPVRQAKKSSLGARVRFSAISTRFGVRSVMRG